MTAARPLPEELEKVVEDAFVAAGIAPEAAVPASRLATWAICEYLIGCRVSFGNAMARVYRDRAIYEASGSEAQKTIAEAENLSPRHIRRIVKKQLKTRREYAGKIQPSANLD
jgi:Mor family transcriptional regulator